MIVLISAIIVTDPLKEGYTELIDSIVHTNELKLATWRMFK